MNEEHSIPARTVAAAAAAFHGHRHKHFYTLASLRNKASKRNTVTAGGQENGPQQLIGRLGTDVRSATGDLQTSVDPHMSNERNKIRSSLCPGPSGKQKEEKEKKKKSSRSDPSERAEGVKG